MASFIRMLLHRRGLVAALLVLSLAAAGYAARTIEMRFQYRDFYGYPGSESLAPLKLDSDRFGDPAGYVVAMIEAEDVFRHDVLSYVSKLTSALEPLAPFSRVRSLTAVNVVRGHEDDVFSGPLIREIPEAPAELAELKRIALASPLLVRRLVSQDARTTAVLAEMRVPASFATIEELEAAVDAMKQVLTATPPPAGVRVRLTGAPQIEVGTTEAIIDDLLLLNPVVCVVLALMLLVIFRNAHGVLLCFASVGAAIVWTAGIFSALDRPVDLIGSVIPVSLLVYSVVDPIFVLARFFSKVEAGVAKEEAIVRTLSELALPCFLTSLTTGIGFGAFITSVSPSVRYFGLTVGIGVLLAFVATVTVLPLLLSVAPLPKQRARKGAAPWLDAALAALGRALTRRAALVVALGCGAVLAGAWFGREQHIDNAYVGSLPSGQTQADVRELEQKLSGVLRMVVYLHGAEGSMRSPDVLRAIERVDREMERLPGVTYSSSLADLVAEANLAFNGDQADARRVPDSKALIAQYLSLIEPRDRADLVTESFAESHIAILLKDEGSEALRATRKQLEQVLQRAGFEALGVRATITGQGVAGYRELDRVVVELLYGFVTALLVVIGFEWLLFRSLRIALLTVIPNLIPVGICLLTTRVLSIPLRIDTVLVLCISIGGLFNTTIHFVARVQQLIADGRRDPDEIVVMALCAIGPPSLFTAVILSIGFAVFMISSFAGLRVLGILSMITLLSGFVSDLLVTPPLLRLGMNWQGAFRDVRPSVPDQLALPTG